MNRPVEQRIETYGGYRDAMRELLGRARHTIAIFDPDLGECGLEQRDNLALLEAFCRDATREDALRIVVCTTDRLERECPRLVALLARFGHRAGVCVAREAACGDIPPSAVVDGIHLATRFHRDGPKGKLCINDAASAASAVIQFETLWLRGECRAVGTPLGL